MFFNEIVSGLKKFRALICVVSAVVVMVANILFIKSSLIGIGASFVYLVLVGYFLGKIVLRDESEFFIRVMFGIFILISLLIFIGTPIVVFYNLNALGLLAIVFAPLVVLAILWILFKPRLGEKIGENETAHHVSYFSLSYIPFLVLAAYAFILLVQSRTGWVHGIWNVVPSSFFIVYFLSAFVLFGIVWLSHTKAISKLLLVLVFSLLSTMLVAIVVYPSVSGDPIDHVALARTLFNYGNLREGATLGPWFIYWLVKEKGHVLLSAVIARMFRVDVYWVSTFIVPVLWGIFVPIGTYKIVRILGGKGKVSVLAALFTAFNSQLVLWGSLYTGNSFGFIFSSVSLYFCMHYLKSKGNPLLLPATVLISLVSWLAHPFTGMMSFAFLFLSFTLKKCEVTSRVSRKAYFIILMSLLICISILPAAFGLNNVLYLNFAPPSVAALYAQEDVVTFSVEKLLKTNMWELVFGEYVGYKFVDAVLNGLMPFLGIVGIAYALSKRKKYEKVSTLYLFFLFMICLIEYGMLRYAMIHVPLGPGRIWIIRDFIAMPFVAITVASLLQFLGGKFSKETMKPVQGFRKWIHIANPSSRQLFALALIGLSFSAFAVDSLRSGYGWRVAGLQFTGLEVEAVKYIDENTDGSYVVIGGPTAIGHAFVGLSAPGKNYVSVPGFADSPSIGKMVDYIGMYKATIGYFVITSFRATNFAKTVAEASRIFGLFKVLEDEHGQIYIFHYKIPPLPKGYPDPNVDVMAFYWGTPSGYYVQNGLIRIVFNLVGKSIDVTDFWGDLYQSIDLNTTFMGQKPLGDLTSIEYFSPSNNTWVEWDSSVEIPLAQRFEFKLGFVGGSLFGAVEKGKPFVQLQWQGDEPSSLSLKVGDFTRLYIPGLVGGIESYDIAAREYGLFYTRSLNLSLNPDIVLRPVNNINIESPSLNFNQIARYSNLLITKGYVTYEVYIENKAEVGQWGYFETWLPDHIYGGIMAPIAYSLDGGKTWSDPLGLPRKPIKTLNGVDVMWVLTLPREFSEKPKQWRSASTGEGGSFLLPERFTDSGGAQNRHIFGIYLPAKDRALVRLGASVYGRHPIELTYVFRDSDDVNYGLRNMREGLIKFYNYGTSVYVGGIALPSLPSSLTVSEDETGKIRSINVTLPPNVAFLLLGASNVDTTVDGNGDGIPDNI